MNVRLDIIGSIRTATAYFGIGFTRPYHDSRPVQVMRTSPRWSML